MDIAFKYTSGILYMPNPVDKQIYIDLVRTTMVYDILKIVRISDTEQDYVLVDTNDPGIKAILKIYSSDQKNIQMDNMNNIINMHCIMHRVDDSIFPTVSDARLTTQ